MPDSERTSPKGLDTFRSSITGTASAEGDGAAAAAARLVTLVSLCMAGHSAPPSWSFDAARVQRISLAASGAILSTLLESTKAPAGLMSRPENPYFLVRQILRIGR